MTTNAIKSANMANHINLSCNYSTPTCIDDMKTQYLRLVVSQWTWWMAFAYAVQCREKVRCSFKSVRWNPAGAFNGCRRRALLSRRLLHRARLLAVSTLLLERSQRKGSPDDTHLPLQTTIPLPDVLRQHDSVFTWSLHPFHGVVFYCAPIWNMRGLRFIIQMVQSFIDALK